MQVLACDFAMQTIEKRSSAKFVSMKSGHMKAVDKLLRSLSINGSGISELLSL